MQTADEFYEDYLAWCTSVNLDKRAILTPRQYELQIMAFLPAKQERSDDCVSQGVSPSSRERR